jgi:NAD-dependent deacetylase
MVADELITRTAHLLHDACQITVLTGAGVSKESGIPTFRDAMDGLWARFDPTQLATRQAFAANPKLVWDFYEYRREIMRPAQPNPGHYALAALEKYSPSLRIITQNIDDLHERAGNTEIIRLHGSIAANKCFHNCQGDPTLVDVSQIEWDKSSGPPPCPYCGRWVRPDVVWFGEMLPAEQLSRAKELLAITDVMLVIGTSGLVSPAAEMPRAAKRAGAIVIEVNPDFSMITPLADVKLQAAAGEVLPQVITALEAIK